MSIPTTTMTSSTSGQHTHILRGETGPTALPTSAFDITMVASLRKQLGHAATALKVIGFWSAIHLWFYLTDPLGSAFAMIASLLTPGCASLIAKRLRSGRTWAVALAAAWWVLFAAVQVLFAPKTLRAGFSGFNMFGAAVQVAPLYFLAQGLVSFAAYRAHQRHDRSLMDPLALNPYEEGLRIKKHPKFINKKSMAAYGLLALSPVPYLLVWISAKTQDVKIYPNAEQALGAQTASVVISLAVMVWGLQIYRRARRTAMLPGSALLKKDARPLVLYLRSFQDDSGIKLRARTTNGRILLERLVRVTFEEVVTDHLWSYGPVLAIGNPKTKHGPALLGAARDYVDDSSWQQTVTGLMQKAAMIVVVVGGTEGLAWEVDTIARLGLTSKLVLMLPPLGAQKLNARWRSLASHAPSGGVPLQIDFTRARAVIFPKGNAALILGHKRNDWTYEAVLDEAALVVAKERGIVNATAPSPRQGSPAQHVRQVLGRIASDLVNMVKSAFVLASLAVVFMAAEYHDTIPHSFASPGEARDSLVADNLQMCREENPELSEEMLTTYCTCFANNLADVVTFRELDPVQSNPSALQAKAKSVASTCAEEMHGQ